MLFMQMLSKKKLQDLVREIDPNEQLDEDVEEVCCFDFKIKYVLFSSVNTSSVGIFGVK